MNNSCKAHKKKQPKGRLQYVNKEKLEKKKTVKN